MKLPLDRAGEGAEQRSFFSTELCGSTYQKCRSEIVKKLRSDPDNYGLGSGHAGRSFAARMAMRAITTSNSINVNAWIREGNSPRIINNCSPHQQACKMRLQFGQPTLQASGKWPFQIARPVSEAPSIVVQAVAQFGRCYWMNFSRISALSNDRGPADCKSAISAQRGKAATKLREVA